MLVRLLLALMLTIGAMPMAAPCQAETIASSARAMAAPAAMAGCHDDGHATPRDRHETVEHGCIGCAALDDWLADRLAPPVPVVGAEHPRWHQRASTGATAPPMLRPPRIG